MFYAVANGRTPGIYNSWKECEPMVRGFPNARYKKFQTIEESLAYIEETKKLLLQEEARRAEEKWHKENVFMGGYRLTHRPKLVGHDRTSGEKRKNSRVAHKRR